MYTDRTSSFRHAQRFERDLNARQRDILARIAKGQTNAEIAAALDITFDGAKWNVSEILTKLGLSSREEAAEYWHWRQGTGTRARSALRALVPAGLPMKLVAGGGFAAVAVVVVMFALFPQGSNTLEVPPYRMEWVSGYRSDPDAEGSRITEWQDDTHFRTTSNLPAMGSVSARTKVHVADGTFEWSDWSSESEYRRWDMHSLEDDIPEVIRWMLSLGPTRRASVDDLLEALRNPPELTGLVRPRSVEVVGNDIVLGVPVVVIEYRTVLLPTSSSDRQSDDRGVLYRAWLDPDSMFVLRTEVGPENAPDFHEAWVTDEVTSIEYDVEFEPGAFTFEPPPGKVLVEATPVLP